jgi:hypothetical protein
MRILYWKDVRTGLILLLTGVLLGAFSARVFAADTIDALVHAALGGTFTDDAQDPSITITIPPGALSADARLSVKIREEAHPVGDNQTAGSHAFKIQLKRAGGGGGGQSATGRPPDR